MAFITTIHCYQCGETKREVMDSNNPHVCGQCVSENNEKEHRVWVAGREGLTMEERVRDIEEWMYHHKKSNHTTLSTIFG